MGRNEFEGRRVRLRGTEPEDWEAWYASSLDTDFDRMGGYTHLPLSRAALRQRAEEASKAPENDSARLTIETLDGTAVGGLSADRTNVRARVFNFGIGIWGGHRRKGYATEALELLFRFYFGELAYQKVETVVYDFNEPSLRFHEAFGFTVEGRRRRCAFTRGELRDLILVGMTVEEFRARHPHHPS